MALATDLLPSDGKARHLKYMSLLVDGGTIVLRHQLETRIQPADLATHLKTKPVKNKIKQLVHRGVISNEQKKNMLYPQLGPADISKLDITLLVCLLRNVSDLDAQLPLWDQKVPPVTSDTSVVADILRLRNFRNKHAHSPSTPLTEQEFEQRWTELEEILQRLGKQIPDLQQNIDEKKVKSIDPEREKELLDIIQAWEKMDQSVIDALEEMKSKLSGIGSDVSTIQTDIVQLRKTKEDEEDRVNKSMSQIQNDQSVNQQKTTDLKKNVEELTTSHESLKRDVTGVKKGLEKQMLSKFRSLLSMSKICMDKSMADTTYIKTGLHRDAEKKLKEESLLVLSGLPGEGKTTMSLKLAAEIADPGRCLILRDPRDWTHVDLSSGDVQTLVIDDIFGAGVMDHRTAKHWGRYLPDMCTVVQEKKLFLIVTTRQYILEEAKKVLRRLPIFKEEHVLTLSSARLDKDEMKQILAAHMSNKGKTFDQVWFDDCINSGLPFFSVLGKSIDFVFGFPQCAKMFVSNEQLFKKGAEFFSKPNAFFRQSIEDLKRDDEKMLALILIWSRNGKPLLRTELAIDGSISNELQTIARKFGFEELTPKFVKLLRQYLNYHAGGFVVFDSRQGTYRLSHHVVEDMVGLVASEDYPEAVLDYCSRDFFLEYVTIDKSIDDEYHLFVDTSMYCHLSDKLLRLILTPPPSDCQVNVKCFKSSGKCSNKVIPIHDLDSELVLRPFFKNAEFVQDFVKLLRKEEYVENTRKLLSTPVLTISGYFLKHGVCLDETTVYIAQFSLLNECDILPRELIHQRVVEYNKGIDVSLLIAVHYSQRQMVEYLLQAGAPVTEDAIYIAAVKESTDIITMLMKHKKPGVFKSRVCNGSSALHVSVKKGLTQSVRCLLDNGVDISHINKDGLCAIDKAIIYKHVDISKLLIDAGSPLRDKRGKFMRTPLHVATDIGLTEVVSHILSKKESSSMLKTKDHRGHFPLQCAAIRGHIDTVKLILEHDKTLATQKIIAYGKKSPFIGGMTVFHIAVWKTNMDMLKMLVDMRLDANVPDKFGRTPLYCAAYDGKVDLVKTLLSVLSVSDVQRPEKQGFTPLHAAIHKRHVEVIKLLCPLSNVNAADKFGRTPLHVACQCGVMRAVKLLLEAGADFRMVTRKGRSCTEIAFMEKHKAIANYFSTRCKPFKVKTESAESQLEDSEEADSRDEFGLDSGGSVEADSKDELGFDLGDSVEEDSEDEIGFDLGDSVEADSEDELGFDLGDSVEAASEDELGFDLGDSVEADSEDELGFDLGDSVEADSKDELGFDLGDSVEADSGDEFGFDLGDSVEADSEDEL